DHRQLLDAVGDAGLKQRFESGDFAAIGGDNELAALFVRHVVRAAELVEERPSFDTEPRLQRAGGIVDARVNDAAVVRAGFETRTRMFLEDADRQVAFRDRQRRGEARDAAADYSNV